MSRTQANKHAAIPYVHFNNADQVDTGLDIVELSSLYQKESLDHSPFLPHRVDFHCLLYIEKGHCQHFIDFNHYPLDAHTCVFINRHQVHAFDLNSRPEGKLLLITEDFIEKARTNIRTHLFAPMHYFQASSPVIKLDADVKQSFEALLGELLKEHKEDKCDPLMLQLLFSSILLKLDKHRDHGVSNLLSARQVEQFSEFMGLLTRHCRTIKSAAEYANMMSMSYKSLNLLCKLVAKKTTKHLIDEEVILQAKRELAISQCQIQILAFELGFDELSNFVKYFKKHTGFTPAKFRNCLSS
ncbi:hypothetical protein TW85_16940 [Marinomonas sp. S3726]|uniref:helix-turn-helix domain-containing protein n=1 Tax=Marinomonas sp. S3726 TaxID=579484 RepID=UPI0005FA2325|nr:helix-turn-helix transcriptional regulator [Marinomonas sp. S3726]KJZ11513.1 hypothetical protein TW85_16940 [Marinomonas sp. S3726]